MLITPAPTSHTQSDANHNRLGDCKRQVANDQNAGGIGMIKRASTKSWSIQMFLCLVCIAPLDLVHEHIPSDATTQQSDTLQLYFFSNSVPCLTCSSDLV